MRRSIRKGHYLYFTSARDYKHDGFGFESRMYALLLRSDVEHPLAPQSDEEAGPPEEPGGGSMRAVSVESPGRP